MKLAILSDTHGLLRPEVIEHLKAADAILHGGDINKQSIVDELQQYAPFISSAATTIRSGQKPSLTTSQSPWVE